MRGDFQLHIIHIAGSHMMAQGTWFILGMLDQGDHGGCKQDEFHPSAPVFHGLTTGATILSM
jgi:hypothetical protein